jgi:hypothetical protein
VRFPQIVGLKCSACQKAIASDGSILADGAGVFCLYCYNPIHVACKAILTGSTEKSVAETSNPGIRASSGIGADAHHASEADSATQSAVERCPACGADPCSPIAIEVKKEVDEDLGSGPVVCCPKCESSLCTPLESERPPLPLWPLWPLAFFWWVWEIVRPPYLQCHGCGLVFRPHSPIRSLLEIALFVLVVGGLLALAMIRS